MLVLNCYGLKGSVHCTPLFQAWTESQEMVRTSALEGTRVCGTCCSFPLWETDTTRHRVGADRSVSWTSGPCKLQYWGPGCACLLQAAPPPQRLQKRLSSAHSAPCTKLRRHLPSPEKGEGAPLVCVSAHGNMEWELVFPQQMWQMFIIFILMNAIIFYCIATYLYCKLAKGFDKIKYHKWNRVLNPKISG